MPDYFEWPKSEEDMTLGELRKRLKHFQEEEKCMSAWVEKDGAGLETLRSNPSSGEATLLLLTGLHDDKVECREKLRKEVEKIQAAISKKAADRNRKGATKNERR
ncbi:MAG: hypothetical protein JW943_04665 [Deltaproteobacteria bacterium]|nr:hypothetical protein [Deltaproteobacteria bacterium]